MTTVPDAGGILFDRLFERQRLLCVKIKDTA